MLGFSSCGASTLKQTLNARLPKSWPATVRSAMLHVVALAKYAAVYTRRGKPGARFDLEVEHLDGRVALPIVRLHRAA
jgi:hypothetical protein